MAFTQNTLFAHSCDKEQRYMNENQHYNSKKLRFKRTFTFPSMFLIVFFFHLFFFFLTKLLRCWITRTAVLFKDFIDIKYTWVGVDSNSNSKLNLHFEKENSKFFFFFFWWWIDDALFRWLSVLSHTNLHPIMNYNCKMDDDTKKKPHTPTLSHESLQTVTDKNQTNSINYAGWLWWITHA